MADWLRPSANALISINGVVLLSGPGSSKMGNQLHILPCHGKRKQVAKPIFSVKPKKTFIIVPLVIYSSYVPR